jgi:long-chain acyl-CoA synthetase
VKKPGDETSAQDLAAYCRKHLAKNKVPKKFVFLDDLPRNGVGKILKTQLRKQAADLQPDMAVVFLCKRCVRHRKRLLQEK